MHLRRPRRDDYLYDLDFWFDERSWQEKIKDYRLGSIPGWLVWVFSLVGVILFMFAGFYLFYHYNYGRVTGYLIIVCSIMLAVTCFGLPEVIKYYGKATKCPDKSEFSEGLEKRGGINREPPSIPKPDIKPFPQKSENRFKCPLRPQ